MRWRSGAFVILTTWSVMALGAAALAFGLGEYAAAFWCAVAGLLASVAALLIGER